jgi:hypothetical protein
MYSSNTWDDLPEEFDGLAELHECQVLLFTLA